MDIPGSRPFRAIPDSVCDTVRCTCLEGKDGERVRTVEHLLAAIRWSGIDNVLVLSDNEEIPIGDGSAASYLDICVSAGRLNLNPTANVLRVDKPYYSAWQDRLVAAFPYDGFRVTVVFTDQHGVLGTQSVDMEVTLDSFKSDIANARTIAFLSEIEELKAKGLALGGTMNLAVVIDEQGYVDSPRYADEPVRHKALDLLGDLAGLGRLSGHFVSIKGGHALNNSLARQLLLLQTRQ
jgi:UDP-3-O-acyl N-acetylglucosamine deacetylase